MREKLDMKNKQTIVKVTVNIVFGLTLLVVLFPLLLVGTYNLASADDWSYASGTYQVIKNGEGFIAFCKAVFDVVQKAYLYEDGRFAGVFYGTLQPGIWGETCYATVAWIMLGTIILSEIFLFKNFLYDKKQQNSKWFWFPIVAAVAIMQILYCPSPVESFYWYTGAMYYTFSYGISLVLLVLFWKMARQISTQRKYIFMASAAAFFAVLVGGGNFGTGLACLLTLIIISALWCIYDKKAFGRTWFITLLLGISFAFSVFAPGNNYRIMNSFSGKTEGVAEAVLMSLVRSATNVYSWTNVKVILMLILIIPFIWKCVNRGGMEWKFKYPVLFTLLTFGLYASQSAPTMYVDGTTGGGRMAAILYYSYHLWLVGNVIYWVGWLSRRENKLQKILSRLQEVCSKYLIFYCAIVGMLLSALIYKTDLREVTGYRAYRDWRQGWAQQYAAEWEERLEVLHDETIKDVVFEPLTVYPEMILYTDLQDEQGYIWVNHACADYYEKNSITVISPQE